MLVVGIDENGLGPLLGPLIVTATVFDTKSDSYDREAFWRLAGPDLLADDSKVLFSRRNPSKGETAFLSWLKLFGVAPLNHRELVEKVCLKPPQKLPCDEVPLLCRAGSQSLPVWASDRLNDLPLSVWNRFDENGIKAHRCGAFQACPGLLNEQLAKPGMNKFRYDFELMIHLIKALACGAETGVTAICGKVGSTKSYGPWFEAMGCGGVKIVTETREKSCYIVPKIGEISFVRDADSSHLPVAVASMIGKYLRELAMGKLNRDLGWMHKEASGYRDKITARFVQETAQKRDDMGLPITCFTRNS